MKSLTGFCIADRQVPHLEHVIWREVDPATIFLGNTDESIHDFRLLAVHQAIVGFT